MSRRMRGGVAAMVTVAVILTIAGLAAWALVQVGEQASARVDIARAMLLHAEAVQALEALRGDAFAAARPATDPRSRRLLEADRAVHATRLRARLTTLAAQTLPPGAARSLEDAATAVDTLQGGGGPTFVSAWEELADRLESVGAHLAGHFATAHRRSAAELRWWIAALASVTALGLLAAAVSMVAAAWQPECPPPAPTPDPDPASGPVVPEPAPETSGASVLPQLASSLQAGPVCL